MFQYANNHDQNYPDGKSSTEVFQKLLDGRYISDPSIFYIPMAGKTKPVSLRLKPENVCWDVTSPDDGWTQDGLPRVFSTGYKVNYVPGGAAVPLVKPYPKYLIEDPRTWWQRLRNFPPLDDLQPGIVVCDRDNSTSFKAFNPSTIENPDGTIPNFVPADFDAKGKTYQQLTPDGPLP